MLVRNLDHALTTTHSEVRVFVIMARYCSRAVWEDARRNAGFSFSLLSHWLAYIAVNKGLRVVEWYAPFPPLIYAPPEIYVCL